MNTTIDQYAAQALEATEAPLSEEEFILAVLPATIRLAVEIGEKRTTLQDDCPTLAILAKLIGIHPSTMQDESRARQDQAIHMAKLLRRGLELADERQQLDGGAAVTFSVGYLSGELSRASLFASDETAAAEEAAKRSLSDGLPVAPAEAYRAGFTSRRDELRAAHQVD
jgi:hypothetical protein